MVFFVKSKNMSKYTLTFTRTHKFFVKISEFKNRNFGQKSHILIKKIIFLSKIGYFRRKTKFLSKIKKC